MKFVVNKRTIIEERVTYIQEYLFSQLNKKLVAGTPLSLPGALHGSKQLRGDHPGYKFVMKLFSDDKGLKPLALVTHRNHNTDVTDCVDNVTTAILRVTLTEKALTKLEKAGQISH